MADDPDPIRAAGAVLWRPAPAGVEVALVHRPRHGDWTFPKGKLEDGEHVLRAAVREVWEETGVRPLLGRRLSAVEYHKDGRPKHVDYWAAHGDGDGFTPNDEIDRLEWLPPAEAERRLDYPHDVTLLREFLAAPPRTVPYIVLRHTSAGDKHSWPGEDLLRPLDDRGREEAAALAGLLACYGAARVFSSATARCVETVLPYATRLGLDVRTERAFTIGTSKGAGDRLAGLLADEVPTIVCTHGELVPELVGRAYEKLGAAPPGDPRLGKGAFWVLQVAGGALTSAEIHQVLSRRKRRRRAALAVGRKVG